MQQLKLRPPLRLLSTTRDVHTTFLVCRCTRHLGIAQRRPYGHKPQDSLQTFQTELHSSSKNNVNRVIFAGSIPKRKNSAFSFHNMRRRTLSCQVTNTSLSARRITPTCPSTRRSHHNHLGRYIAYSHIAAMTLQRTATDPPIRCAQNTNSKKKHTDT